MEGVLSWLKTNHIKDADLIQEVALVLALQDLDLVPALDHPDRDLRVPVPNQSPNLNLLPAHDRLVDLLADHHHVRDLSLRLNRNPNLNPVLEADHAVVLTREAVAILEITADRVLEAEERAQRKANRVPDPPQKLIKEMSEQLQIKIPKTINLHVHTKHVHHFFVLSDIFSR